MSRLVRLARKNQLSYSNGDIFADATVGNFVTEGAEVAI